MCWWVIDGLRWRAGCRRGENSINGIAHFLKWGRPHSRWRFAHPASHPASHPVTPPLHTLLALRTPSQPELHSYGLDSASRRSAELGAKLEGEARPLITLFPFLISLFLSFIFLQQLCGGTKEEENIPSLCFMACNCVAGGRAPPVLLLMTVCVLF